MVDLTQTRHEQFPQLGFGVGLRAPHYRDFLARKPQVDWLEVHTENHLDAGSWDANVLRRLRLDYPISLHGVGLGIGSATGISATHLQRVNDLVRRIEPALVSEHLCWGAVGERHLNDLLPMPLTEQSLTLVCRHVDQVQHALNRRILLENVSTYLRYRDDMMSEAFFLAEVARRTGCGVLLDINNLYVNQCNHNEDASVALEFFKAESIGEIHLAGHLVTDDAVIDHHGARVAEPVWLLYEKTIRRFGSLPTLIEWDTDIPSLDVLLSEAQRARDISNAVEAENTVEIADLQSNFAAALLDVDAKLNVPNLFNGEEKLVQRRFSLYRNNLLNHWSKALGNAYPVLKSLVGDDFFNLLVRCYGNAHPSTDGDLNRFGEHLSTFLLNFPQTAEYPYFPDMARLEWTLHRAHYACDAELLSFSDFVGWTPEQIDQARLIFHPAVCVMSFDWNVIEIWHAHQQDEPIDWPVARKHAAFGLVARDQWKEKVLPLTSAAHRLLGLLEQGQTIGDALDSALKIDDAFELGLWLRQWLEHGVFATSCSGPVA